MNSQGELFVLINRCDFVETRGKHLNVRRTFHEKATNSQFCNFEDVANGKNGTEHILVNTFQGINLPIA